MNLPPKFPFWAELGMWLALAAGARAVLSVANASCLPPGVVVTKLRIERVSATGDSAEQSAFWCGDLLLIRPSVNLAEFDCDEPVATREMEWSE